MYILPMHDSHLYSGLCSKLLCALSIQSYSSNLINKCSHPTIYLNRRYNFFVSLLNQTQWIGRRESTHIQSLNGFILHSTKTYNSIGNRRSIIYKSLQSEINSTVRLFTPTFPFLKPIQESRSIYPNTKILMLILPF